MRSLALRVAYVVVLGGSAACGISVVGQSRDDAAASSDGGVLGDSSSLTDGAPPVDSGSILDDAGVSACDAGPGNTEVIVAILPRSDAGACPAGSTETALHSNAQATNGACTCTACTPTKNPSCGGNGLQLDYGLSSSCNSGPLTYNVTDGACTDFSQGTFTVTDYHGWSARTPQPGTCTATSTSDPSKVTTTTTRACIPTTTDAVCAATSAGERLCVHASSTSTCTSATFSVPMLFGDGPAIQCAPCGCSLTSTKCTIEYHPSAACNEPRYVATADNVCTRTNNASGINHFKIYAAAPVCTATPGAPTVGVSNSRTLCCTP